MTSSSSSLSTVQDLYAMQVALWNVLDSSELKPEEVQEAKKTLRTFSSLLNQADWQVMGGEDVYAALQSMQQEVAAKLRTPRGTGSSVRSRMQSKAKKGSKKRSR